MRGFHFSKYDPSGESANSFEKLLDLFMQLLIYTSGDFNEAMQWLNELDKEYNLTDKDYGIGDFIEQFDLRLGKQADDFALWRVFNGIPIYVFGEYAVGSQEWTTEQDGGALEHFSSVDIFM